MRRILLLGALLLFSSQLALAQVELPVTFEDGDKAFYELTDFGGNASELVEDPTDATNTVVQSVKSGTAQTWAGTTVADASGFASPIPFTSSATTMTVRVWSHAEGTPVRLKVEDHTNAGISVETEVMTTVTEAWETLTFDFSNEASGTSALNVDNNYTKASLFYNFGTSGADAGELTYYWDDVEFVEGSGEPTPTAPAAPAGFVASDMIGENPVGDGEVFLAVGPNNVEDADISYRLFYSETASAPADPTAATEYAFGSTAGDGGGNAAFGFTLSGLNAGTEYTFWLYQYNTADELFSEPASATVVSGGEAGTGPEPSALDFPITFEEGADWGSVFTGFDGGALSVIANPDSNDVNPTDSVLQMVKNAGQPWGGGFIQMPQRLEITESFAITAMVWAPRDSTTMLLKIENNDDGGVFAEKEMTIADGQVWTEVTFDLSTANVATDYGKIVMIFDNGTAGDGSADFTWYVDELRYDIVDDGGPEPSPIMLPVTFEDGDKAFYELTDFGGNSSEVVEDPTDATNMVVQSIKGGAAETWAGTTVADVSGFTGPIPFTEDNTSMSVRVWSPAADIPVRLKVEDHTDGAISVETEAVTTVTEDWETLTFDFSNEAAGTAALNLASTYTKASMFFNFGTTGADAGALTFYWDDMMMAEDGGSEEVFTTIADARSLTDSTLAITGIATTPNYGFSNGQWFLQDATGGINVFFGGQGDLEVAAGDEHILYGTISSFDGQVQISVDSAEVVSTGNEVPFPTLIDLDTFLNVEAAEQGMYVALSDTATYLADESAWPVDGFSDWSGSGTNVSFQIGEDTITYRIDRDEAFFDGTEEPADGAQFFLSGILSRFNESAQLFGGFFEEDIVEVTEDNQGPFENLVTNGDFELGQDGSWYGNAFNIQTENGNSYNYANVASATDPWNVNISNNVDLELGEYYIMTFDAATDSGNTRTMVAGIGLAQAPWYAATETVTLTDSMQTFTLGLFAIDSGNDTPFGDEQSRVLFDMGADVGVVVIDNVSLIQAEAPVDIFTPIADARMMQDSSVVLNGIASTPNYGFNHGQWFLQDETGGINVFFAGQGDLEVNAGDEHILYGTISSFDGQTQISVDSAEVVSEGNDLFVYEIGLDEFLNVESEFQGLYVALTDTATYLAEESAWPVEGFSDWAGAGTNVSFQVGEDTITYRIDRDEAFFDGTEEPVDGAQFFLSGILSRFNETPQFYGGFFEDDIVMADGDMEEMYPVELPVTFEADSVDYELTDFGGNSSEIVVDPTDSENMVVRSTKSAGAETWAGTTVADVSGFANPIPFTENSTLMSVRVWSPAADIPVRLKVEDHTDGTISVETEAMTTVAEEWEVLVFDFSNEAQGTAALNLESNYTKASMFFNFGTTGADAGELTFYWDDLDFGVSVNVEDGFASELPTELSLKQNYPNPFNPSTNIEFALPETGKVQIEVFNMLGQRVATLVNSQYSAGNHTVTFNASRLTSGIYFYRLTTGSASITKRMTLIK